MNAYTICCTRSRKKTPTPQPCFGGRYLSWSRNLCNKAGRCQQKGACHEKQSFKNQPRFMDHLLCYFCAMCADTCGAVMKGRMKKLLITLAIFIGILLIFVAGVLFKPVVIAVVIAIVILFLILVFCAIYLAVDELL